MKLNRENKRTLLLVVIVFLWTAFIFSNSFVSAEDSGATSGRITAWLKPFFDAIFGEGKIDLHFLVRKAAHLLEFCLLGILTLSLARRIGKASQRSYGAHSALFTLLVGVTDEYIQSFTGRGSQVQDVLIDFTGAMLGFALVATVTAFRKGKGQKKEGTKR